MGYNWNIDEIFAGNIGSAMPYTEHGEKRLEPSPSKKNYISGSAAWMKYEIRVPVGDTSKYEETIVILEPMTTFFDDEYYRESRLFREDRERGYDIVKKFYDKAKSLYGKHKKKFSKEEKEKIEKSLDFAGSYLRKVKGAIDYWSGHSLLWPIDDPLKEFGYGACSYQNVGKLVKDVRHPKYPDITVDVLCPTSEEIGEHDRDQGMAKTLLTSAASYTRFAERMVWPKEVKAINQAAAAPKRVPTKKATMQTATLVGLKRPVKVMTVNVESIDKMGDGDGVSEGKSTKKKKKSALPLIAVAGLGVMLLARK